MDFEKLQQGLLFFLVTMSYNVSYSSIMEAKYGKVNGLLSAARQYACAGEL